MTQEALERIGALHAIEAEIRGKPPDERRQVRQARAQPLLASLETWLRTTLAMLSRKSDTAQAILYALNRWNSFVRYMDDGRIEIDNSAAERALRGVALGRRNYLFAGADSGGMCSRTLPSTRSTASTSCCLGMWQAGCRPSRALHKALQPSTTVVSRLLRFSSIGLTCCLSLAACVRPAATTSMLSVATAACAL